MVRAIKWVDEVVGKILMHLTKYEYCLCYPITLSMSQYY